MYICLIKNKVSSNHIQEYLEGAKAFAHDMKLVDGCINTYIMQDDLQKDIVVNVEIWKSKKDKDKDDGSVFLKHKSNLRPYFISNEIETYNIK